MNKKVFVLLGAIFMAPMLRAGELNKMSRALSKGMVDQSSNRIAVMSFLYHDAKYSSGSSILAERLTTQLVREKNVHVIERRLIKKMLDEQKMSEIGLIDPDTAKKMGAVLGVDAIVTGTLIDLDNGKTEVNARMIATETGEILSAAQTHVKRTWDDKPRSMVVAPAPSAPVKPEPVVVEEPESPSPTGQALRLSNENFPAGRRGVHREPSIDDMRPTKSAEAGYDSGYNDGYYEGRYDGAKKEKKAPSEKVRPSLIDRRLEESREEKPRRIYR